MINILVLLILSSIFSLNSYAQGDYRDPFTSVIVENKPKPEETEIVEEPEEKKPDKLNIRLEGVIWSKNLRQAIINGNVYNEGDILDYYGAKLLKVREDKISVFYNGVAHEIEIFKSEI
jgi:type II secretory pathway component PulC